MAIAKADSVALCSGNVMKLLRLAVLMGLILAIVFVRRIRNRVREIRLRGNDWVFLGIPRFGGAFL